jgi:hypothetical protein
MLEMSKFPPIRRLSLLRFGFSSDPTKPSIVDFEMDEKEFGVIGYALVHWSFMEHALQKSTIGLASALNLKPPADATQDSFRRRLNAFRGLVELIDGDENKNPLRALAAKISKENGFPQTRTSFT